MSVNETLECDHLNSTLFDAIYYNAAQGGSNF